MKHRSDPVSFEANAGPIIAASLRIQRQKQATVCTKTRGSAKMVHENRTTCAHQNLQGYPSGQLRL
jgi:hypothetical protein